MDDVRGKMTNVPLLCVRDIILMADSKEELDSMYGDGGTIGKRKLVHG